MTFSLDTRYVYITYYLRMHVLRHIRCHLRLAGLRGFAETPASLGPTSLISIPPSPSRYTTFALISAPAD